MKHSLLAPLAVLIFISPAFVHAADIGTIDSLQVGGATITNGATVTRDNFSSISNFWTFNFSWPNFVPNNAAQLAIFRGTFGNVEGGALNYPLNFSYQNQAWPAGNSTIQKQFVIPSLGALGTPSGTYTAVIGECGSPCFLPNWFASGGTAPGPDNYKTITFTYSATSNPTELPGALASVQIRGKTIAAGESVYRADIGAPNGTTDNYWIFDFNWPHSVSNQQALIMVFRGTYGALEGGAPVSGANYAAQLQAWSTGHNNFGKFMNLPALNNPSTTDGTYTVLVAERDSKYLSTPTQDAEALWFATGGAQGIAPTRYTTLTFEFKGDQFRPVIIVPGILGSAEKNGQWVIDPITHIYDNLIDTLDANGYTREEDLFTFPYDWKRSNVETALLLRDKIDQVQDICNCTKVDIVAHSMGGLVSRQYIQSGDYENDVRNLVFLGTPHLGAPKDYLMWEAGEHDSTIADFILGLYLAQLAHEAGFNSRFEYVHLGGVESVRELLPVYSYLFDGAVLRTYPNQYPSNPFLQNLSTNISQLTSSGVLITNVVGDSGSDNTITSLDVVASNEAPLWVDGKAVVFNRGEGDDTVPVVSAAPATVPASTTIVSDHIRLPTNAENYVFNKLTGKTASVSFTAPLPARYLLVRIFSPADFLITAPNGERIGRDLVSGSELSEISGAFYSGFNTDTEFVIIPDPQDGEYTITAIGTGTGGGYTLATNYITESGSVQKDMTGVIAPDQVVESVAELQASNPDPLEVHSSDEIPPAIAIASPLAQDYLHSVTLPIDLQVTDAESGVANTTYLWDGVATTSTTIDLFFHGLGAHTFSVEAADIDGNAASSSVTVNVITNPESTILDIQRSFTLGWIKKANIRDTLVQKVSNAVKIEKKIELLEEKLPRKPKVVKRIEKLEARFDKILGVKIIKELDTQLGKGNITQQAYDLIKADVQYLLTQP